MADSAELELEPLFSDSKARILFALCDQEMKWPSLLWATVQVSLKAARGSWVAEERAQWFLWLKLRESAGLRGGGGGTVRGTRSGRVWGRW